MSFFETQIRSNVHEVINC